MTADGAPRGNGAVTSDGVPAPGPAAAIDAPRLRLAAVTGLGQLDGGWWPRSRDVGGELEAMLAALPASVAAVTRVTLCMADWPPPHPGRVAQAGHRVRLGWFAQMEPHTLTLGSSSADARLLLLVVPPELTDRQAERAMAAAAGPATQLRATAVLAAAVAVDDAPAPADSGLPAPRRPGAPVAMTRTGRTA